MFEWEDFVNGHFCLFQINVDEYAEEQTIMRPDSLPVWTVSCFPWGWDSRLHVCAARMKQNETFRPGEKSSWEGGSHCSRSPSSSPSSSPRKQLINRTPRSPKKLSLLSAAYDSLEESGRRFCGSVALHLLENCLWNEARREGCRVLRDDGRGLGSVILTGRSSADWWTNQPLETTAADFPASPA